MTRQKIIITEDDVKKKVIDKWMGKMQAWFFKPVSNGMGKHGVPDYIACVPVIVTQEMVGKKIGLFVAPEAKRPAKKLDATELQKGNMESIDLAGGVTGVVSSAWDMAHMEWRIQRILKGEEK